MIKSKAHCTHRSKYGLKTKVFEQWQTENSGSCVNGAPHPFFED